MGIISWIKDKYYDISFQKAKTLIAEGDTDEAIRVLESILESILMLHRPYLKSIIQ